MPLQPLLPPLDIPSILHFSTSQASRACALCSRQCTPCHAYLPSSLFSSRPQPVLHLPLPHPPPLRAACACFSLTDSITRICAAGASTRCLPRVCTSPRRRRTLHCLQQQRERRPFPSCAPTLPPCTAWRCPAQPAQCRPGDPGQLYPCCSGTSKCVQPLVVAVQPASQWGPVFAAKLLDPVWPTSCCTTAVDQRPLLPACP